MRVRLKTAIVWCSRVAGLHAIPSVRKTMLIRTAPYRGNRVVALASTLPYIQRG